jgi:hypothetical protein
MAYNDCYEIEVSTMRSLSAKNLIRIVGCLAYLFVFAASGALAQTDSPVPHLGTARRLVQDLQHNALVNEYGSRPTYLRWDHPTREARTVCATFIARLFEHTYGWKESDIRQWLGASGADASEWQKAIVSENGFRRLRKIGDVHPGDLMAIKYNDGSKDTGHIMVVDQEPEHIEAATPIEQGTEQYGVVVIDSSATGHGPTDTRHRPDGSFTGGIGRGTFRLYTDLDGRIVGYAWSETPKSEFYQSPTRDLVVGRLTRQITSAEK